MEKTQNAGIVTIAWPWLVAAAASASLPLLFRGVYELRPVLRQALSGALVGTWPFCSASLEGIPGVWAWASGLAYWGLGGLVAFLVLGGRLTAQNWAASVLASAAVALLLFGVPLLSVTWTLAFEGGHAPLLGQWLEWEGNHGPWRHLCPLRQLVGVTLLETSVALVAGVVTLVVKPSWTALGIAVVCVGTFLALIATHLWLID